MLKLMYITNSPAVAEIADAAGVDRIFVDLEKVGKAERQRGWNSVKSQHSTEDIPKIKAAVRKAQVLVRTDPVFDGLGDELNEVFAGKPDVVMLPYFKTVKEVETFVDLVDGRAKTSILVETKEAAESLDDILSVGGIDEVHIGLNDLSHSYRRRFLFEMLADGTVDRLVETIKKYDIESYGFGGIAAIGKGLLPAEWIIPEHYRLGSTCAILSRAFCDTSKITDLSEIEKMFNEGVKDIRVCEKYCSALSEQEYEDNRRTLAQCVDEIVHSMSSEE